MAPEPVRKSYAVYDENGVPHSEFKRVCLRCGRPMRGYSYRTFYGVFVRKNGKRIPAGGEPLHDRCPPLRSGTRETPHDGDEPGESAYARTTRNIEPGIDLKRNGRYAVRANKKRLGTYATLEEAQSVRAAYLKKLAEDKD